MEKRASKTDKPDLYKVIYPVHRQHLLRMFISCQINTLLICRRLFIESVPLYVDGWRQRLGDVGASLPCGGHDGFPLRLELVHKVVHLLPFGAQFQSLTGSAGSEEPRRERRSDQTAAVWCV